MFLMYPRQNVQKSYIYSIVQKNANGRINHVSENQQPFAPDSENGRKTMMNRIQMVNRLEAGKRPEERNKYAICVQVLGMSDKLWFNSAGQSVSQDEAFD